MPDPSLTAIHNPLDINIRLYIRAFSFSEIPLNPDLHLSPRQTGHRREAQLCGSACFSDLWKSRKSQWAQCLVTEATEQKLLCSCQINQNTDFVIPFARFQRYIMRAAYFKARITSGSLFCVCCGKAVSPGQRPAAVQFTRSGSYTAEATARSTEDQNTLEGRWLL